MTLLLLFNQPAASGATGTAFQSFVEAGMFLGIWQLDDYLTFTACVHDDTGAAADADAVPSYAIYENETATAIVTGNMAKLGAVDGFYSERLQLTAAAGFEIGKCYAIRIAATVGTIPAAAAHVLQIGPVPANVTQLDGDPVPLDNLVLSIQSGGYVRANLMQILGTTLTETAGLIAAAFSKFFNKATPTGTVNSLPDAVAGAAGGLALAGADGDTLETLSDQLDSVTTLGAGAIAFTYTLTSSLDASPIADADIWATSDANGATVLASGRTNSSGQATFFLDAGTVYIWRQKSGWNFTNPDTETVS